MPAKVKVRIVAGRDLPIMDRSSELTDAFVEVFIILHTRYYKVLSYAISLWISGVHCLAIREI